MDKSKSSKLTKAGSGKLLLILRASGIKRVKVKGCNDGQVGTIDCTYDKYTHWLKHATTGHWKLQSLYGNHIVFKLRSM